METLSISKSFILERRDQRVFSLSLLGEWYSFFEFGPQENPSAEWRAMPSIPKAAVPVNAVRSIGSSSGS